jgi:chromosome segregation ATPase
MPREAAITYEQVAAAAEALKSDGLRPTARAIREKLGGVGSMQTILKLQQAWKAGQERQRDPGQGIPTEVQRAILEFLDVRMTDARASLAAELSELRKEMEGLAAENDQLTSELEEQAKLMHGLATERANTEGRATQLSAEVERLRAELLEERQRAEKAHIELSRAELRLDAMPRLEAELETYRQSYENEHQARIAAEQSAAVLAAQKTDLQSRLTEIKSKSR